MVGAVGGEGPFTGDPDLFVVALADDDAVAAAAGVVLPAVDGRDVLLGPVAGRPGAEGGDTVEGSVLVVAVIELAVVRGVEVAVGAVQTPALVVVAVAVGGRVWLVMVVVVDGSDVDLAFADGLALRLVLPGRGGGGGEEGDAEGGGEAEGGEGGASLGGGGVGPSGGVGGEGEHDDDSFRVSPWGSGDWGVADARLAPPVGAGGAGYGCRWAGFGAVSAVWEGGSKNIAWR